MGKVLFKAARFAPRIRYLQKNYLFFVRPDLKALTLTMRTRFLLYPFLSVVLAGGIVSAAKPTPAPKAAPTAKPAPTISKPVVDQTEQTNYYCLHRFVYNVSYPC